jgi:hypothetical protein
MHALAETHSITQHAIHPDAPLECSSAVAMAYSASSLSPCASLLGINAALTSDTLLRRPRRAFGDRLPSEDLRPASNGSADMV